MKTLTRPVLSLIAALIALSIDGMCSAADVRTFGIDSRRLPSNGYVEATKEFRHDKYWLRDICHIWFTAGCRKYRLESGYDSSNRALEADVWRYDVFDGKRRHTASAVPDRPYSAKWYSYAAHAPVDNPLDIYLTDSWQVADARLVGREQVLGLRAEHWTGVDPESGIGNTRDLWVSIDTRFPVVLKVFDKSKNGVMEWRITRLDLKQRVPDYVFTAQVDPKPEFLRILVTPNKPTPVVLIWHAIALLAYIGGVASFAPGRPAAAILRRVALGVVSVAAFSLLIVWQPKIDTHMVAFSGTPFILAYSGLTLLSIILMIRLFGRPGGASLLRGAGILPVLLMLVLGYLGMKGAETYCRFHPVLYHDLKWIFVPAILVNVLPYVLSGTALEELVFRGYLFSALQARFRKVRDVIAVQAVIFAIYHMPFHLTQGCSAKGLAIGLGWLFLYGLLFGFLRWRYRGLLAPWLAHLGFNMGYFYVYLLYLDYITRFIARPH